MATPCAHSADFVTTSSAYALVAGYTQPSLPKRLAATVSSGRTPSAPTPSPSAHTFPAPLVLPSDDLALDPNYPPQTFRS